MKRFKHWKLTVALLVLVMFHPGCGTVYTFVDEREGLRYGLVMSGVRLDYRCTFDDSYMQHVPGGKLFSLLDMPASLVSDLVLFPATVAVEFRRSRRRDERLYGTWVSDRDRNLAEYHKANDRRNVPEEIANRTMREYGRRSVTFSKEKMVEACDGFSDEWPYRVVSSTTNQILVQCGRKFTDFELEDHEARGFRIDGGEYYRKKE